MNEILTCTTDRWQPVIGDPSWRGWATVLIYLAVMVLAALVARRAPFPGRSRARERLFWIIVAVLMGLLAINKQLDLQSALTVAGRCASQVQGWYQDRRLAQALFLMMIAVGALVTLITLLRLLRGTWSRSALPILGLCFVTGFVLMRAVGFHHFDRMLPIPVLGVRANTVLEWIGPLLIGAVALWLLLQPAPARRRRSAAKTGG